MGILDTDQARAQAGTERPPDPGTRLVISDVVLAGRRVDLVIAGNRLAGIEPAGSVSATPDDQVLAGQGRLGAFPPFYNAHTHAAMTVLRGYADDLELSEWLTQHIWPAEGRLVPEDIYAGSRLAILEMIKSGTVFFNDMYWTQVQTVRAVRELGVRAAIGLLYFTDEQGQVRGANRASNAEVLEMAADLPDRIQLTHAPHAVYTVAEPVLREIAAAAQRDARMVHIHASETAQEVRDCVARTGLSPIGLLDRVGLLGERTLLAHCVHLDDCDRELIAARGAVIAHMPVSNLKLCSGTFDLRAATAAGCRVVLGTDGAASNNSLSMLAEMKFASMAAKQVTGDPTAGAAARVHELATSAGAGAFGIDAGDLIVGALADLILVDLDHPAMVADHDEVANLVYAADSAIVDTVICDGRVLMAGRVVPGEAEIIAAAREAAQRVRSRRP